LRGTCSYRRPEQKGSIMMGESLLTALFKKNSWKTGLVAADSSGEKGSSML
jgi:hypothetical protein